jgi:hypothetical protein
MAALGPGPGFIHVKSASTQRLSVQRGNGAISLGAIGHFNEAKATWLACVAVADQRDSLDSAVIFEQCANGIFSRAEIQITDKNVFHLTLISLR